MANLNWTTKTNNVDDVVAEDFNNLVSSIETELNKKVNADGNKVLSDNNFTTAYKTSLDNLPTELDKKVDKITGKGLSANDYTDTDKAEVAKVKDKVGFTDYATDTKVGVVKVGTIKGIKVNESGEIGLNVPNKTAIAERLSANSNLPITIGNLDYAVRSVRPVISDSVPDTLAVNTIYGLGIESTLTLNLPYIESPIATGDFIQVDFYSGKTPTNLTITSAGGLSDIDLSPEANTMYSLFFDWGTVYCDPASTALMPHAPGWRFSYAEYPHKEV